MTVRITVTVRQWVLIAIFSLLLTGALVGLMAMDASTTPRPDKSTVPIEVNR